MDKKMLLHLVLLCAVVLVLAVPLYLMCRHDSDLLEFVGAVYGGLVTVIGIIVPIFTDRQKAAEETRRMYETEYRPQIKLTFSDYQYDAYGKEDKKIAQLGYPIYFGPVKLENLTEEEIKKRWRQVSGVIPLQIQNIGSSDIRVEKMEFQLVNSENEDSDENESKTEIYKYTAEKRQSFTVYSKESFDAPVKLLLPANKFRVTIYYRAIIGMDKNVQSELHTKTYWVYAPSRQAPYNAPVIPYREWLSTLNISRRS